jgi:Glycosyltransferase family 10 (fucosyltransferase) C-term
MSFTVRYRHFWPGFSPKSSLFQSVLSKIIDSPVEIVVDPARKVDLEFQSVYRNGSTSRQVFDRLKMMTGKMPYFDYVEKYRHGFSRLDLPNARRSVWYTAENFRNPNSLFSGTIGFDASDSFSNSLYFPFWMYRLDWGLGNDLSEIAPKPEVLVQSRSISLPDKDSVCVFSSTRDPGRMRLVAILESSLEVVKYGTGFHSRVASKMDSARGFRFQLSPENSLTSGYITEKLIESWVCGNLPIWEGLHADSLFNKNSYIDVTRRTAVEIISELQKISNDDWLWRMSQPLLHEMPTIVSLQNFLKRTLDAKTE